MKHTNRSKENAKAHVLRRLAGKPRASGYALKRLARLNGQDNPNSPIYQGEL